MELSVIIGITNDGVIGIGSECFHNSADKEHFKMVTQYTSTHSCNLLVVGRKTWETIPTAMKNCNRRKFLVLTRKSDFTPQHKETVVNTFEDAMQYCLENKNNFYKIFVIGGAEIYKCAMESGFVTEIFLTGFAINFEEKFGKFNNVVKYYIPLDGFVLKNFNKENGYLSIDYTDDNMLTTGTEMNFCHYIKEHKNFELQYINLITDIIANGTFKETRNGMTLSITDRQLKIDLADGFPILTIRKSFWRGIVEELLWMLTGSTNANILKAKDIHIWDGNTTREFLDKVGLTGLPEGDIGAGYGFQMRYTGASYVDCRTDYKGKGFDQLTKCVEQIKTNPNDRRIIISLWNAADLGKTALPPCHLLYQFTVTRGKLSCHLYQRSWDVMLGWNTSTAALLTHILAHYCGLEVGTLTHTICDVHIYESHVDAFNILKNRLPFKLPKLEIVGDKPSTIDGYISDQFKLVDYKSHGMVKMAMVA